VAGATKQVGAADEDNTQTASGLMLHPLWMPALAVEHLFMQAQVAMAHGNWDEADTAVSAATTATEGAFLSL
jgi:hypothetical protein